MADVNNAIAGKLVKLSLSTALVTPAYKEIVCGQDVNIEGSKDVSTVRTKCGVLKTAGDPSWQITGSGVANHTPGVSEMSADELITAFQNGADVLVLVAHATDDELHYRQGRGIITSYSETSSEGESVTFDFTIEISGNLTLVPAA